MPINTKEIVDTSSSVFEGCEQLNAALTRRNKVNARVPDRILKRSSYLGCCIATLSLGPGFYGTHPTESFLSCLSSNCDRQFKISFNHASSTGKVAAASKAERPRDTRADQAIRYSFQGIALSFSMAKTPYPNLYSPSPDPLDRI